MKEQILTFISLVYMLSLPVSQAMSQTVYTTDWLFGVHSAWNFTAVDATGRNIYAWESDSSWMIQWNATNSRWEIGGNGSVMYSNTYACLPKAPDLETGFWRDYYDLGLSEISGPGTQSAALLPVEWLSLEAQITDNGQALISWSTASELNNDLYAVERSADNLTFIEIGRVPGGGTAQEVQEYEFRDENPKGGMAYYRIKQVDVDGGFSYSPVLETDLAISQKVHMYPNPMSENLTIESKGGQVEIYTLFGKLKRRQYIDDGQTRLSVEDLEAGLYFVEVTENNGNTVRNKMLKLSD